MASCSDLQCSEQLHSGCNPTAEDNVNDIYTPPSNYSTYSQEVKYIFEPICSVPHQDYSYIRADHKNGHLSSSMSGQVMTASSYCARSAGCHSQGGSYRMVSSHYHSLEECSKQSTWSPAAASNSTSTLKNYYSNDNVDTNDHKRTDSKDEDDYGPPKLAPVSGILTRAPGQGLIRPIAFKPVVSNRYTNRGNSQIHHDLKYPSQDDGYGSQDYNLLNQGSANTSHGSLPGDGSDPSSSFSSDIRSNDRPDSLPISNLSHLSSSRIENYIQTPSPSDSGVGELEAMLKEKEHEIMALREVMDKNERAIFQVYEEQKNSWHHELKELKEDYEKRSQVQQKKTAKNEQTLSLQVYKLQQESKKQQEKYNGLVKEKENLTQKCLQLKEQLEVANSQLKMVNSELQQKNGECTQMLLKMNENTNILSKQSAELKTLKMQVKNVLDDVEKKNKDGSGKQGSTLPIRKMSFVNGCSELCNAACQTETSPPHNMTGDFENVRGNVCLLCSEKDKKADELQQEIRQFKKQVGAHRVDFEHERDQWLEEKSKVIRYQKQLQLNYIQMFRKNKNLEAEVEQLTLELESRDLKLLALNGGEESVC